MLNRWVGEDIRDYWSARAATYDLSPGHGRMAAPEARAWQRLIRRHLGAGAGRLALDLGCGTGTMTLLLRDQGFAATGLDFAEPMLERARRKAGQTGIGFLAGDAGHTLEPDGRYDVLFARNLLWTLPEPEAALRDWLRILRPGGRILIVDGDFARIGPVERLLSLFGRIKDGHALVTPAQWHEHGRIMARLPFGAGLRVRDAARLLEQAGFAGLRRDDLRLLHARRWPLGSRAGLAALGQHRFAISASRPPDGR